MEFNFIENSRCPLTGDHPKSPEQFKFDIQTTYGVFGCIEPNVNISVESTEKFSPYRQTVRYVVFPIRIKQHPEDIVGGYQQYFVEEHWGKPFSDEFIKSLRKAFMQMVLQSIPEKEREMQQKALKDF